MLLEMPTLLCPMAFTAPSTRVCLGRHTPLSPGSCLFHRLFFRSFERVSLCSLGLSGIQYVDQASLEPVAVFLPHSPS